MITRVRWMFPVCPGGWPRPVESYSIRECYDTSTFGSEDKFGSEGMGTKQQILKAIEELPEDAGVEDAIERLYLLYKVEKGLGQADRGELIPHQEVRRQMAKWIE